ncbi:DUF3967 domain-containing protein [Paenibacillus caseinilyticus]|uniref:DUF3967 domain-containing protein n=1 Tax=Paenibacillus mucilaginosus K02 TaxID=997761 RepID=I0BNG6_9BACL|nr:DUF3967 domain-containing protein [Paenibacillus mucilaginosus]AFH63913.1 hypothetical protein B2K_25045 [Paenibacillus mucilaginosus K02]
MLAHETTTDVRLTHDLAKQLGISDSSLRRWCRMLEFQGYSFVLGEDGARVFREQDLAALKRFQVLVKHKRMNLEDAAKGVMEACLEEPAAPAEAVVLALPGEPPAEAPEPALPTEVIAHLKTSIETDVRMGLLPELLSLKQSLNEMDFEVQELKVRNKKLLQQFAEQQEELSMLKGYIENRVEQRDKELMFALREIQQTKTQMAAARDKRWWKFWDDSAPMRG